jgi:hypothetical protein
LTPVPGAQRLRPVELGRNKNMAKAKSGTVRAVGSIKWKGEYRIPGEESAIFDCTASERKELGDLVVDHVEDEITEEDESADESEE